MPGRIDEKDILFRTFAEITSLISLGKDNRVIFNKIINIALDLLPTTKVYLIYVDDHSIVKYWLNREVSIPRAGEGVFAIDLSTLARECLDGDDRSTMVISAPLMAKNSLLGVILAINDPNGSRFNEDDIHLLAIMANQAAIAFENFLLYRKLEMESITDGLTGVYNYRFLIRSLRLEIKRSKRFNNTFSFLMLDVDNLKEYNDRNGHLSGSRALTNIASILQANSREIDIVAKYGGDEFGILLPGTSGDGAKVYGERVLDAVRRYRFDGKTPGLLTCSIGISVYPDDASNVEKIIDRADTALYKAKTEGKNSIRSFSGIDLAVHA
jgi:diguanylate cyclase (GGDEF)-like protein